MINSGLKINILKECLEHPIVENSAIKRGGREITKNIIIFSVMDIWSSGIATNKPIWVPLAAPVKRQAAKAVRNLPPKSPLRGPVGLITRQTPNSSNLKKSINKYLIDSKTLYCNCTLQSFLPTLSLQMQKRIWRIHKTHRIVQSLYKPQKFHPMDQ